MLLLLNDTNGFNDNLAGLNAVIVDFYNPDAGLPGADYCIHIRAGLVDVVMADFTSIDTSCCQ